MFATALRIRPTTKQDATSIPTRFQRTVIHAVSNQVVSVDPTNQAANPSGAVTGPTAGSSTPAKKQTFAFDQVHGQDATQFEMYTTTAAPLLDKFLEGFNCTILAYGHTSSGKTYVLVVTRSGASFLTNTRSNAPFSSINSALMHD